MTNRAWTVIGILRESARYLEGKGVDSARRSAELLLGKALGLGRIELYLQQDRPVTEIELAEFRELVKRRAHREPLQYILGRVEFCGLDINVAPGVLVPRPETEELALLAEKELRELAPDRIRILDIGTGTGCLAVFLAARLENARVDAVDIDPVACACSVSNAERHRATDRVQVIQADLFSDGFLAMVTPPYDALVSNPPYVTADEHDRLMPEVRDYEARHALVAERNGLAFYDRLAELVPTLLKPGGRFFVEIGRGQDQAISSILNGVTPDHVILADTAGIPRMIRGVTREEIPIC
ncbi:MAG: peptide chain release factor N(5)-glutamine methyltransferase [bacterium]|nr:peptide chain release factor N(5)-glutamine methyltransferase [bacterium]